MAERNWIIFLDASEKRRQGNGSRLRICYASPKTSSYTKWMNSNYSERYWCPVLFTDKHKPRDEIEIFVFFLFIRPNRYNSFAFVLSKTPTSWMLKTKRKMRLILNSSHFSRRCDADAHTTIHFYFFAFRLVHFILFVFFAISSIHQKFNGSSVGSKIKNLQIHISTSFECATNVAMIQRMTSFQSTQSFSVLAMIRDTTFKIKMNSRRVRKGERTKNKSGVYRAISVSTMCLWHTLSANRCNVWSRLNWSQKSLQSRSRTWRVFVYQKWRSEFVMLWLLSLIVDHWLKREHRATISDSKQKNRNCERGSTNASMSPSLRVFPPSYA